MTIQDDGNQLVVVTDPPAILRIAAWFFIVMAGLYVVIIAVTLLAPRDGHADWPRLIAYTLLAPLWAYVMAQLARKVRLEVDRGARTVTHTLEPMFGHKTRRMVTFDQVRRVVVGGNMNWATVVLSCDDAALYLAKVPRVDSAKQKLNQLLAALQQATGAPLEASADLRKYFDLPPAA